MGETDLRGLEAKDEVGGAESEDTCDHDPSVVGHHSEHRQIGEEHLCRDEDRLEHPAQELRALGFKFDRRPGVDEVSQYTEHFS